MSEGLQIIFATDGEPFHGLSPEQGPLGGSETAMVQLARAMARRGHDVQVFCNCPNPGVYHGVRYRDRRELVRVAVEERVEVVVVSRYWAILELPLQAGLKLLWNHDILERPHGLAKYLPQLDACIVLSKFHAGQFARALPESTPKLWISRNGIDTAMVLEAGRSQVREEGLVLYVSRPERGLKLLLEHIWPRLTQRLQGLKLKICTYQVDPSGLPPEVKAEHEQVMELVRSTPGVEMLGGLDKRSYYRLVASASAVLYPCTFPEISCIAAIEAQALGTPIVTTDGFALSETVVTPQFRVPGPPGTGEYVSRFVDVAEQVLTRRQWALELAGKAKRRVLEYYDWDLIGAEWEQMMLARLEEREHRCTEALAAAMVLSGDRLAAARLVGGLPEPPEQGLLPPIPREQQLLEEMARVISRVVEPGGRVGVVAPDGGMTAGALARMLPGLEVEEAITGAEYDLVVLREVVERAEEPWKVVDEAGGMCREGGKLLLCIASGAWPLVAPGRAGRLHDIGKQEIERLVAGRGGAMCYLPAGLVRIGGERYPAGVWLVVTPAHGPSARGWALDRRSWRVRPVGPSVVEELRDAGLL